MRHYPTRPLRDLLYVADQLQELVKDADIYKTTLVKIPTPDFIVFYNGLSEQPDYKILKLSDSFEVKTQDVKLELLVTMLNINVGHNQELMAQCKTLRDYSLYVDKVRTYAETMVLPEAVTKAVDECIKDDILKDFLRKQKAEAIKVTIYEYDQALHEKTLKEEGREEGFKEGEALFTELTARMLKDGRADDLLEATKNLEVRNKLYQEYDIKKS